MYDPINRAARPWEPQNTPDPKIELHMPGDERSDRSQPARNSKNPSRNDVKNDGPHQEPSESKSGNKRRATGSPARTKPAKQVKNAPAEDTQNGPNTPKFRLSHNTTSDSSTSFPTSQSQNNDTPNPTQKAPSRVLDLPDVEMTGTKDPPPTQEPLSWADEVEREEQERSRATAKELKKLAKKAKAAAEAKETSGQSDEAGAAHEGGEVRMRAEVTYKEKHKVIIETRGIALQQTDDLHANPFQPKPGLSTASPTPAETAAEKDAAAAEAEQAAPQAA
ncbi:hypothetical protein ACJ73_10121 [Blastomyces percursus]|uniref:Uncharacterized protein n=1 Tax=Blastomyces percursus TaxID=1658174 RepID=A0A1J9P043_9EURO|nr:hypothetical protein ACJ73_10121 [Blastomyces percursus]